MKPDFADFLRDGNDEAAAEGEPRLNRITRLNGQSYHRAKS